MKKDKLNLKAEQSWFEGKDPTEDENWSEKNDEGSIFLNGNEIKEATINSRISEFTVIGDINNVVYLKMRYAWSAKFWDGIGRNGKP